MWAWRVSHIARGEIMEHAGSGLHKIMATTLRQTPSEDAAVLAWPLVCGTAVADKTRALDFSDGVLSVQVPDTTWRAQLLGLSPQYVAAANKFVSPIVMKISSILP